VTRDVQVSQTYRPRQRLFAQQSVVLTSLGGSGTHDETSRTMLPNLRPNLL